jgi:hypothetical protein
MRQGTAERRLRILERLTAPPERIAAPARELLLTKPTAEDAETEILRPATR